MITETCVFCRIAAGELPADKVYEDELILAFLDISPINKGHTLVIPREHHNSITTVPAPVQHAMMEWAGRLGNSLMRATDGDGFNLLLSNGRCAGQVVAHAHLHVIPRSPEDGVVLPSRSVPYESDDEKAEIIAAVQQRLDL